MSDDLEIRHGGAIAVDTESLRTAATGLDIWRERLAHSAGRVRSAGGALAGSGAAGETGWLAERIGAAADRAQALAERLRGTADVYELVELSASITAADLAGDVGLSAALAARRDAVLGRNPWAGVAAWWSPVGSAIGAPLSRAGQAYGGAAPLGPVAAAGAWAVAAGLGWGFGMLAPGVVPGHARLAGPVVPVTVRPVAPPAPTQAPPGLAAAARRIPGGEEARVRVERYTMPDGSRQFAVYVAGTQGGGATEAFDMDSNVALYGGERSASYEAVREALSSAGAAPGDVVHAFGHSQGAMIAGHLALAGEYDVKTLVSFGSPIEADVPGSTLSVTVRHTDDPVAALAGHGSPAGVGSPDSFVAERLADADPGLRDLGVPAHRLEAYAVTAELLDESTDPRMGEVRRVLGGLEAAASIDVVEYSVRRATGPGSGVSPSSSAGAG